MTKNNLIHLLNTCPMSKMPPIVVYSELLYFLSDIMPINKARTIAGGWTTGQILKYLENIK